MRIRSPDMTELVPWLFGPLSLLMEQRGEERPKGVLTN